MKTIKLQDAFDMKCECGPESSVSWEAWFDADGTSYTGDCDSCDKKYYLDTHIMTIEEVKD